MTTIKSYGNILRFKSIFAKEQFLNYLKTNFCNLGCNIKSKCNIIYFTAHSSNIPEIIKIENHINNLTVL